MGSNVKPGDLVMVVKANTCCGDASSLGQVFAVSEIKPQSICRCSGCGGFCLGTYVGDAGKPGTGELLSQVVKIDPPAEGDSLPTRQNLEVTA